MEGQIWKRFQRSTLDFPDNQPIYELMMGSPRVFFTNHWLDLTDSWLKEITWTPFSEQMGRAIFIVADGDRGQIRIGNDLKLQNSYLDF